MNFDVSLQRDENNSKFDTVDNTVDNRPPFTSEANLKAGGPAATMVNSSEAGKLLLDQIILLMIASGDLKAKSVKKLLISSI